MQVLTFRFILVSCFCMCVLLHFYVFSRSFSLNCVMVRAPAFLCVMYTCTDLFLSIFLCIGERVLPLCFFISVSYICRFTLADDGKLVCWSSVVVVAKTVLSYKILSYMCISYLFSFFALPKLHWIMLLKSRSLQVWKYCFWCNRFCNCYNWDIVNLFCW